MRPIREYWEDWKAYRRGEVRVASGLRGRVYVRKEEVSGGAQRACAEPEASISARVYRDKTGNWEDLGVIAKTGKE